MCEYHRASSDLRIGPLGYESPAVGALTPAPGAPWRMRLWPRLVEWAPYPALIAWQLSGGVGAENTRITQKVPNVSPGQGMFGRYL